MEDYINLYHQKLWEIAFSNVVDLFLNHTTISIIIVIYGFYNFAYISFGLLPKKIRRVIVMNCIPIFLFLISIVSEAVYSYDRIMNPHSTSNSSALTSYLFPDDNLYVLKDNPGLTITSVDGNLKKEDILFFAASNPVYDSLFGNSTMFFTGKKSVARIIPIAVVGYEQKNDTWQSADIRIAPGDKEDDFQKFSKVLHIEREESSSASFFISNLKRVYEMENERKPKNN